jgi:molybdopterin converting factor subunit 1
MEVKVVYFASARELAAKTSEFLALPEGSTVSELKALLVRLHPALRQGKDSFKFSVNFDVVGIDSPLKEGDEVGVLPPVAGG